jgi:hypothetical protein
MEETTESEQPSLYNHAAKFGAIMGIISIALVIVLYVVSLAFMATFKFLLLILVITIGFVIYAGINYRNETGGYLSFGKAYLHGVAVMLVAGLLSLVFNLVLYSVIDPELPQKMTDIVIENTESMMAGFGAPQASIDEAIDKMKIDLPEQFSTTGMLIGFWKQLVGYLIFALITALFVRKNQPVEM